MRVSPPPRRHISLATAQLLWLTRQQPTAGKRGSSGCWRLALKRDLQTKLSFPQCQLPAPLGEAVGAPIERFGFPQNVVLLGVRQAPADDPVGHAAFERMGRIDDEFGVVQYAERGLMFVEERLKFGETVAASDLG